MCCLQIPSHGLCRLAPRVKHNPHLRGVQVQNHQDAVEHDGVNEARLLPEGLIVQFQTRPQAQGLRERGQEPSPVGEKKKTQSPEDCQDNGRGEKDGDPNSSGRLQHRPLQLLRRVGLNFHYQTLLRVGSKLLPIDLQEAVGNEPYQHDRLKDQQQADRSYRPGARLIWFIILSALGRSRPFGDVSSSYLRLPYPKIRPVSPAVRSYLHDKYGTR